MSAHWRKAPLALRHHASALLAVSVAALLLALAAASAPFVTTAVASEALQNKVGELSPYATGLQIQREQYFDARAPVADVLRDVNERDAAARDLGERMLAVRRPIFTTETPKVYLTTPDGDTDVRLLARTGALAHVKVLARTSGPGVWISNVTADAAHVRPGGFVRLDTLTFDEAAGPRLRVKGIYRSLDQSPRQPYWSNLSEDIFTKTADDPPLPPYVLIGRDDLLRVAHAFGGKVSQFGPGSGGAINSLTTRTELPVDATGLTLADARALERRFAALARTLPRSAIGRKLGCGTQVPGRPVSVVQLAVAPCVVLSSLTPAVILADRDADAASPAVTLLSDVGVAIGLAVAAAAGAFLVRRRRAEAALLYARGESGATFAGRTTLETLLPFLAGGAAGFGIALAAATAFAPRGALDPETVRSGAAHAAGAVALGLGLLVATAAAVFLRLYDTGARARPWLRFLPWELALLGIALLLLVEVRSGHGLAGADESGGGHPTLAVFLFPLLLVAAGAGLRARAMRLALRRRGRGGPPSVYLALRRLAAARGMLVVLAVVSAVALGAAVYAETLAVSLHHTTTEKAYLATGSDATGSVDPTQPLPRRFPYPATKVEFGNQVATVGTSLGRQVDLMLVDPATLPPTLHWESDWGADPTGLVRELARSPSSPLPVIVTSELADSRVLVIQGKRFPIRVLGTVRAFPLMAPGVPLVVTSFRALHDVTHRAALYDPLEEPASIVWAKGPPADVGRALAAPPIEAQYVTTVDEFLRNPDVLLATRTFGFLRTIALAASLLVLVALLLYLQARQRSQAIASALARRMGFGRAAETLSLCLEVAGILAFAAIVGGGIALAAARPITRHLDPLPDHAPTPIFTVPTGGILLGAGALLLVAAVAGALTSWLASRADVSEALRVA